VKVQHIKPRGHAADFVKHDHDVGNVVAHRPVEPKACLLQGTSRALVSESPLANKVTSCPCLTSSSVRYETILSVPP
jgi:hypothetical protein